MEHSSLSLQELNSLVRKSIRTCLPDTYWVQAELSDVRANYSGHCYLEFVQKDAKSNALIAKARGIIWSNVYYQLKAYFERETGQAFVSGIKVLVKVSVDFHELYGYSLTVTDIDPTYTLGDMALRRKEILKRLDEEGVLTLNKELALPELTQRIAVISSATAAGYGDFCNQLENNAFGFAFHSRLFPAVMQGEAVESSIISALERINAECDRWDVVAAEFLINHLRQTAERLERYTQFIYQELPVLFTRKKEQFEHWVSRIPVRVQMRLQYEHFRQERLTRQIQMGWQARFLKEEHRLQIDRRIATALEVILQREKHRLALIEQQGKVSSPELLLKKGYSITLKNGRAVTDATQLLPGDEVVTKVAKGEFKSKVI